MTLQAPTYALSATAISLRYPGEPRFVLQDFNLKLAAGEIVSILGPSGIGKSSLLRVLAGLQPPDAGTVTVDDTEVKHVHPRLTMAFQQPGLLPWLDLKRNVAFGLDFRHQPRLGSNERSRRVERAIAQVGLEHARHLRPGALSGGMAQRVALARCLARQPRVLLLDEPFSALDEVTRAEMQALLLQIVAEYQTAAVLVTHDIDEALLISDRVILLGGTPASIVAAWPVTLSQPRDNAVQELGKIRIDIVSQLRIAARSAQIA